MASFYNVQCVECGKVHGFDCSFEQAGIVDRYVMARLYDRRSVKPIHEALPFLNEDDREMLLSGICPTCWERLFPSDEDEGEAVSG